MADFIQSNIALVYDFDRTLSPRDMQEPTVLRRLGIPPEQFWDDVGEETRDEQADQILTYMRLLVERIEQERWHIAREHFKEMGEDVTYFPGVENWFDRVNEYVRERVGEDVHLHHYIISAGLKEILDGVSIKHHFRRIYASEYYYNHHNIPTFPKLAINYTNKTQFLFRINKGREDLDQDINKHMPERERPIPFSNMVYIGDGMSDVPSMNVVRKSGGFAIAVFDPGREGSEKECRNLYDAERVDFFAEADYREGSELEGRVYTILDLILASIAQAREAFEFARLVTTEAD